MDIVKIQSLIAQGRVITDITDINPNETFVQVGVYQPNNRKIGSGENTYPSFAIALSELGGIPTLQQVLDFNHDLVDGNNFQGTNAGDGATNASNSNFFGNSAGVNATNADNSNFLGQQAGYNATNANFSNFFGKEAGKSSSGFAVNAFGSLAAFENTGFGVNAIGGSSAVRNIGNSVNAFGATAAYENKANFVNAIGFGAAYQNEGENITAIGFNAGSGNTLNGMTIFSNVTMPSYANFAAASAAITTALGASAGCTYLYHDQATNSIGAVRL